MSWKLTVEEASCTEFFPLVMLCVVVGVHVMLCMWMGGVWCGALEANIFMCRCLATDGIPIISPNGLIPPFFLNVLFVPLFFSFFFPLIFVRFFATFFLLFLECDRLLLFVLGRVDLGLIRLCVWWEQKTLSTIKKFKRNIWIKSKKSNKAQSSSIVPGLTAWNTCWWLASTMDCVYQVFPSKDT